VRAGEAPHHDETAHHAVDDPRQKYWHPSWIEPDRHYRRIRVEHTKRALTLAKELGAKCITTEPGGPLEGRPWGECLKLFIEMLKPVVEHAEKEQVLLLVEPEPDLLIETADQYLEFASKLSSPYLGLNFDIGHSYCVKDDPAANDDFSIGIRKRYLSMRKTTIYAGSNEIQRNIIAKMTLGL
jgi:L-ribulose-5-phosphate 3-epimerase UlaE